MSPGKRNMVSAINRRGQVLPHTLFLLRCGQKAKEDAAFIQEFCLPGDTREHGVNTQLWLAAPSSTSL